MTDRKRRASSDRRPSQKIRRSEDVLETPLREHLSDVKTEAIQGLLAAAEGRDLVSFLAGMSLTHRGLVTLLASVPDIVREGRPEAALSLVHTARQLMPTEHEKWTALRWARLLQQLGCHGEAVDAYARCETLLEAGQSLLGVEPADILAEYSEAAADAGRWLVSREKAEAALKLRDDHLEAMATLSVALFELGEKNEALELAATVLRNGGTLSPTPKMLGSKRYVACAAAHSSSG